MPVIRGVNGGAWFGVATQDEIASYLSGDTPKAESVCEWLGVATGEIALVRCATCAGNVRKKFEIHTCSIFGECLPEYGRLDGGMIEATSKKQYQGCPGCLRKKPTQSGNSPVE